MFASNVLPKRFGAGKAVRTAWACNKCGHKNAAYWSRCTHCGKAH